LFGRVVNRIAILGIGMVANPVINVYIRMGPWDDFAHDYLFAHKVVNSCNSSDIEMKSSIIMIMWMPDYYVRATPCSLSNLR
jgi:hypothetical protein